MQEDSNYSANSGSGMKVCVICSILKACNIRMRDGGEEFFLCFFERHNVTVGQTEHLDVVSFLARLGGSVKVAKSCSFSRRSCARVGQVLRPEPVVGGPPPSVPGSIL